MMQNFWCELNFLLLGLIYGAMKSKLTRSKGSSYHFEPNASSCCLASPCAIRVSNIRGVVCVMSTVSLR